MNLNPKVSVIVPVYNAENYIDRCLKSISDQTYKNLEIILIDDGSIDNSLEICNRYSKQDSRFHVIYQSNKGVSYARNKGLELSSGDFIYFVDNDDYIDKYLVEDCVNLLIKYNADMICFNYANIEKNRIKRSKRCKDIYTTEQIKELIYNRDIDPNCFTKFYRYDIWKNLRFSHVKFEDFYIMADLVEKCNKIICSNKCYYYYDRTNDSSVTNNINRFNKEYYDFVVLKHHMDVSKTYSKKRYFIAFKNCVNSALRAYHYAIKNDIKDYKKIEEIRQFFDGIKLVDFFKLRMTKQILLFGVYKCKIINIVKSYGYIKK